MGAMPDENQQKDVDFLMALGEIFALVVYAHLNLENSRLYEVSNNLLDQIFDFMVRDFSRNALNLFSKSSATSQQMAYCQKMIRKPIHDEARYQNVWNEVHSLADAYELPE